MTRFLLRLRNLAFLGMVVLVILGNNFAAQPVAAAGLPWQNKDSPFGVVAALGNRIRSDEMGTAVKLMKEAGVQWQREEIFWHEVQQRPRGPFRWTGDENGFYNYDKAISTQVAAGINVLGLLDYGPAWYKGRNPPVDAWVQDWGDFVYATVAHYGRDLGWIKYWELWNEPNLAKFGYESGLYRVEDFVRILAVGQAAARAADPEAKIIMGGLSGGILGNGDSVNNYEYLNYLEQVAQAGGWNYVDIIAVHPYHPQAPEGLIGRENRMASLRTEFTKIDELLLRYGAKPIWITELGWFVNHQWPGVDADTQAFYLVRTYLLAITHPSIEKVFWYDFRNDTWPQAPYDNPAYSDDEAEFHYGLLRRSFPLDSNQADLRKPSFIAYRALTQMLGGLFSQQVIADGDKPEWPGVYWYRFANAERRVDVLWRTGDVWPDLVSQCNCREALIRNWNGEVNRLLYSDGTNVTLRLEATGAPLYVEYDPPVAKDAMRFDVTNHTLRGALYNYWVSNGGIERFGYPITEEIIEPEAGTGIPRVVQYFDRVRFEHHPELSGTKYEVKLNLLGDAALRKKGIDWQTMPKVESAPPDCFLFKETGHSVCAPFRQVWERYGGIPTMGYPLTEAFEWKQTETDSPRIVQYFQRARLEIAPEDGNAPEKVKFGLLVREMMTSWGGMWNN